MNNKYINNRLLISLLKEYGVKKLVLSSGARNIPFVSNVEVDDDFQCFSIIDERNAAFFGLGLAQQSNEPVAIACTSGTAASNYVTGVTEAFYSNVPLVVLTFDRNPYMYNQLETQKIDQESIFKSITKKSVTLPVIKDEEDIWYCNRLLNDAFISMNKHGSGPIHINIPLVGDMNNLFSEFFDENKFIGAKKIDYVTYGMDKKFSDKVNLLNNINKLLLVIGQDCNMTDYEKSLISKFASITNCPILTDNLSNFKNDNNILAGPIIKSLNSKSIGELTPELVISFGNNMQERIKEIFRRCELKHWYVTPDGEIRDCFKKIDTVFEFSISVFFEKAIQELENFQNDGSYLNNWKKVSNAIKLPEMQFTNFYVCSKLAKNIPNDSILHLSILNATRQMQFFELDKSVKVYSNVNAFGIDGCLPTFMGQAYLNDKLSFIVIGDLSFFYGMNALSIKHRRNNIRVLMINNGGGAEFHIQPDSNNIPTIDKHIGAAHDRVAKDWAISSGYRYLSASDKESFDKNLLEFIISDSDKPIFFEVFTNMKKDGEFCLDVYRKMENSIKDVLMEINSNE